MAFKNLIVSKEHAERIKGNRKLKNNIAEMFKYLEMVKLRSKHLDVAYQ